MLVSRLRMGWELDGVGVGVRECGGGGRSWQESVCG